jgi:toxin CcdB
VLNDEDLLLGTPKMGAVPQRILKTPITSLTGEQAQRSAALDFFF